MHRYLNLKQVAQKLSRDKRSVAIIDGFLKAIFTLDDVEATRDDHELQLEVINNKFLVLHSLAKSCKVSSAELLKLAGREILGRIAHMVMLNSETLGVISFHCDSET